MGPAPLLLLPLLASLLDSASEDCGNGNFKMDQPEHLTAPKGGAVRIPCSFHHSWELAEILEVNIDWRRKHFHGDFIYDTTLNWTHEEFKDRVRLDWTQGQTRCALLIWNLRRGDATMSFCQVTLQTKSCGPRRFQLFQGTNLSITPAQPDTGLDMTNGTQSSPLTLDTMVAIMVTVTLLKMTILGLISYLVWKRSQGS
ncbi:paired immunoglobulin-like type 2 receptor alpha [Sorex fumeus]|uniref:paired immunoglobulin-like type 2 receptor alpha n=1 Tax=Sorex fumeus TaxID=62283 RepID=UPI0024ADEF86|nr:paired immunoglobulin-like type 2 receptor alpha [Sorex fumeus]XP_055984288.1 paired immunoglobulin-like type 2 receptor alpha [Sorex fumeus]